MKKLKQTVLVLATVGMVSVQAQAAESSASRLPVQQPLNAAFSQQDVQGLFDQGEQPMQLAALSQIEMKETEGALLPIVYRIGGGVIGMIGGGTSYLLAGGRDPRGFAVALASGFGGGVFSPVNAGYNAALTGARLVLSTYRGAGAAFGSGFASGYISTRFSR